ARELVVVQLAGAVAAQLTVEALGQPGQDEVHQLSAHGGPWVERMPGLGRSAIAVGPPGLLSDGLPGVGFLPIILSHPRGPAKGHPDTAARPGPKTARTGRSQRI